MSDFPVSIKKGRPSFRPTDEHRRMVEAMTGYGIPQKDIARVIGIHEESLRKHFRAGPDGMPIEIVDPQAELARKQAATQAILDAAFGVDGRASE